MLLLSALKLCLSNLTHLIVQLSQIPEFLILRAPIVWYNSGVKLIQPLLLVLFSCGSFAAVETPLHSCPPPDTEYETNLVADAWDDIDRIMGIRFEFNASPSNNVQAAFGVDENHDGVLSVEESELTVGWDCGSWFVSGYGVEFTESAAVQTGSKSFSWSARLPVRHSAAWAEVPPYNQATQFNYEVSTLSGDLTSLQMGVRALWT